MGNMGTLGLMWDAHRARRLGPAAVLERQRARLAEMVAFARASSPYYRDLYKAVPESVVDPTLLPVTDKKSLMPRFDEWVTDRGLSVDRVRAFVADSDLVGRKLLERYTVVTTSGTTGTPGIFLVDDRTMSVVAALMGRMLSAWLGVGDAWRILSRGWRMANVVATGGHFAGNVAAAQHPRATRAFPVDTPLPALVARLNDFRPIVLGGYASTIALLAGEQEAGRLRVNPVLVLPIAEGLSVSEYERIGRAFRAKVRTSYAASECPFLSYGCEHRWLHVNADWVVVEPVDADYRPTPPGDESHTVLVTNLANRVQPILRYDLGDSVLLRPDPCPCGNPLPAIRVRGRTAEVLKFPGTGDETVSIPPLALEVDHVPGVELFQVVQVAPTGLRLRLRVAAGADKTGVWKAVTARISHLLAGHGLAHVTVEQADEPPEQSPGGKYRAVIPLPGGGPVG